jgi:hypothetical protein
MSRTYEAAVDACLPLPCPDIIHEVVGVHESEFGKEVLDGLVIPGV